MTWEEQCIENLAIAQEELNMAKSELVKAQRALVFARFGDGCGYIWSGEYNAYFKPNSKGYTCYTYAAGIFTKQQAEQILKSAGKEKQLKFLDITKND